MNKLLLILPLVFLLCIAFGCQKAEEVVKKPALDAEADVEAYNLYLQGRFFWNKRTEEGLKKAIECFNKAIENDQNYALAYSGLADSYNLLGTFGFFPSDEAFHKAKEAALKAIEIDDTLSEGYTSLAWVEYHYNWDWKRAEENFKKAIELNPEYVTVHHWYAYYLSAMGRFDEAIEKIEKALELDPLSLVINRAVGTIYSMARQYDKAEEALKKVALHSVAAALANKVLPQPGGPKSNIPAQGFLAPVNSSGLAIGRTIASLKACFTLSNPAISSQFTLGDSVTIVPEIISINSCSSEETAPVSESAEPASPMSEGLALLGLTPLR